MTAAGGKVGRGQWGDKHRVGREIGGNRDNGNMALPSQFPNYQKSRLPGNIWVEIAWLLGPTHSGIRSGKMANFSFDGNMEKYDAVLLRANVLDLVKVVSWQEILLLVWLNVARLEYYSEPGASSSDGHDQLELEALSGQPVNWIREKTNPAP